MYFRRNIVSVLSSIKWLPKSSFGRGIRSNAFRFTPKHWYKEIALGSATILGISFYLNHKNKIVCDIEFTPDNNNNEISYKYEEAITKSRDYLQRLKYEKGIPGIVIGVSIDGKTIWKEGIGYSDLENQVPCSPDTVMRIASISKSITMAAVAKLWEEQKLDIDKPVQDYVPSFPIKTFNDKPVTITCRQLLSHLGGIRHYKYDNKNSKNTSNGSKEQKKDEFSSKEYYMNIKFETVKDALDIFKDDPLVFMPGTKFHYSSHGWTLVSAIVEAASKEQFTTYITKMFKTLGLKNTYLDENDVIIYNRSRNYMKNKQGSVVNAPNVDNSYKWAGGGFLSTVGDLLQFGNAMLYSLQFKPVYALQTYYANNNITNNMSGHVSSVGINNENGGTNPQYLPGFLNHKTIEAMWTPSPPQAPLYGMGWSVNSEKQECQFCEKTDFSVFHTGGAVGASSILYIQPGDFQGNDPANPDILPKGIIVTIITNMHNVGGLCAKAKEIVKIFKETNLQSQSNYT